MKLATVEKVAIRSLYTICGCIPVFVMFFVFPMAGCSQQEKHTYRALPGKPVELPDAGSSWYSVQSGNMIFRAKKITIISGELSLAVAKSDSAGDITLLQGIREDSTAAWETIFNVSNQQMFSITMNNPAIYVVVNKNLKLILTKTDDNTINRLMAAQENALEYLNRSLSSEPAFVAITDSLMREPGEAQYFNPNALLAQVPDISVYDGPEVQKNAPNAWSFYVTGSIKGNLISSFWVAVNTDSSKTQTSLTLHGQLQDTTGKILQQHALALPDTTPLFFVNTWSTHIEFIAFWQNTCFGKPLPAVLLPVAGIVVRNALVSRTFGSDLMISGAADSEIIMRSGIFSEAFPIGQATIAAVTQKVNPK